MSAADGAAIALGLLLCGAGVGHFLVPTYFEALVPPWIPRPRAVVATSGIADLVVGVMILAPATRSVGGWSAAALISGYLVSHLDAARRADREGPILTRPAFLALRLVVNLGYIAVAVAVASSVG